MCLIVEGRVRSCQCHKGLEHRAQRSMKRRSRSPQTRKQQYRPCPMDMLANVPKSGGPENEFFRVAKESKRQNLGANKITFKAKNESVESEQDLPEEEKGCI